MVDKKIVASEQTVRSWVKRALGEHGVPQSSNKPPIEPTRTPVVDSGDVAALTLPPYQGPAEKRPPPRSTKSTRNERGIAPEDLQKISSGLKDKETEIGGKVWTQNDLYIPEHRGLGVSGVRKELETGSDKLQIAHSTPELVIQMLEQAVKDYKNLLREPVRIVQAALREYSKDLETGDLSRDEIVELRSAKGQVALATTEGFKEFFNEWVKNDAPSALKRIASRTEPMWFGSVFSVARTGTLNLDDKTPAKRSLSEDFILETSYRPIPTVVDRALILRDPGFRYYVGGLGGKHVYYWDAVRNAAEKAGRYSGQF